jgi:hypothetical protein
MGFHSNEANRKQAAFRAKNRPVPFGNPTRVQWVMHASDGVDGVAYRRILVLREVNPGLIAVVCARSKQMPKIPFVKYTTT